MRTFIQLNNYASLFYLIKTPLFFYYCKPNIFFSQKFLPFYLFMIKRLGFEILFFFFFTMNHSITGKFLNNIIANKFKLQDLHNLKYHFSNIHTVSSSLFLGTVQWIGISILSGDWFKSSSSMYVPSMDDTPDPSSLKSSSPSSTSLIPIPLGWS